MRLISNSGIITLGHYQDNVGAAEFWNYLRGALALVGQEQTDRGRRLMARTGKLEMEANGRSSELYFPNFHE